ncbi:MAG: hypothetical protein Q8S01_06105 [Ignavibacteria bacterium]|nr:hypothetical protein [Ignavibacteria bacterium]
MKRFTAVFALVLLVSSFSFGQFSGKSSLGLLAGFGGGGLTGNGAIPIAAEFNFYNYSDKLQLGAFAGYSSTTADIVSTYKFTYTYIIVAGQGTYHFSPGEKFDPFAGVALGYNIGSVSNDLPSNLSSFYTSTAGGLFYSGFAGFNYWLSQNFAVQARVGYFPYVGAGITYSM